MRLLMLLLLLVPFSSAALAEGVKDDKLATLTVHGEAVTKVAPDQVMLPVTVQEQNVKLKAAKQKHDEKLRALLKLAEQQGIAKDDMQTASTSVSPMYDYTNGRQHLTGYQVSTTIDFKIKDLLKLADFMDSVVNLGINEVGSVSYSLQHEEKVKQDTLDQALRNAHDKATQLASVAQMTLEKPLDIQEGASVTPPRPMPMMAMRAMSVASADAAPNLPAGLMEVRQEVTVTYQIK
ncbi:MAG TPA: SIMPL domain-containing protein [Rickettsiales bacterium]|nr:SIMPL domain-containing protein [Rickettsiales bacterium]